MATTTTIGATVLDVPTLVSQLMSLERKPIDTLNNKVTDYQAKISAFGTLKGLVSSFQSALRDLEASFQSYSATASDPNILSATAGTSAVAGAYSLAISQLARAQNLVAVGQTSDTTAIAGTSESTLSFTIGTTTTDVTIPANATLQDIRDAINAADLGVAATIINDGSATPYCLALTASETGVSKSIGSISATDGAVSALLGFDSASPGTSALTQTVPAADASFTVNGIPVTSSSNDVSDAIQGVTLTLKAKTTTDVSLTVARDTSAINTAVSKFVDAYNALASQLKSRSAYATAGSTAGVLAGDGGVRQMLDQLRGIFLSPATGGTLSYLSQVGISTQTDGSLKFDSAKLGSAMASDFRDVTNLFSSASGFLTRLDSWSGSTLETGGLIDSRTTALNNSVKGFNDNIDALERRMTALQKQYTVTYSNLNLLLANMNSMSSYLTSQFSKSSS